MVVHEFNLIVAENRMKFQAVHPERDVLKGRPSVRFDFTDADDYG